ncbi:MAG: DUF2085 domain-containing protein [archaeon]
MIEQIYNLGFFICHQMIPSSHFFNGLQFPLCARQVGMHLGFLIGLFSLYITGEYRYRKTTKYLLLFIVPLGIDGFTQLVGLRESSFHLRVATGLIFGIGMAYAFNSIIRKDTSFTVPSPYNLFLSLALCIPGFLITLPFIQGASSPFGWIFFWAIGLSIPLIALYPILAAGLYLRQFISTTRENLDKLSKTT